LITDSQTAPGESPFDSLFVADDPAASALETAFVREGDVIFDVLEAAGGTDIQAGLFTARAADFLFEADMDFFVHIVFVQREFVFDFHGITKPPSFY
jgi:hypothetical protein